MPKLKMPNTASILFKVYAGFFLLSLLLAVYVAGSLISGQQIKSSFTDLVDVAQKTKDHANEISATSLRTGKLVLDISNSDQNNYETIVKNSKQSLDSLKSSIETLEIHLSENNVNDYSETLELLKKEEESFRSSFLELKSSQSSYIENNEKVATGIKDSFTIARSLFTEISKRVAPYAKEDQEIANALKDSLSRVDNISYYVSNMLFSKDISSAQRTAEKIYEEAGFLFENLIVLQETVESLQEEEIRNKAANYLSSITEEDGVIANYISNLNNTSTKEKLGIQISEEISKFDKEISIIVQKSTERSQEFKEIGETKIDFNLMSSYVVLPLSIVFSIVIAWWIGSLIRKPLNATEEHLSKMANGDYSEKMNEDYSGEFKSLAISINKVIQAFSTSTQETLNTTQSLGQISLSNKEIAINVEDRIENQTTDLASVATAVTEMESAIQEVASHTTENKDRSIDIENHIADGLQVINENKATMVDLNDKVNETQTKIEILSEESEKISSIASTIDNIAEQTNLLALNAAIEAARAGEHGRGFAVVADEVRNLASQTRESTEMVRKMVENLQVGSTEATKSMSESREKMSESMEMAEKATQSVSTISDNIKVIVEMTDMVSVAIQEQHHVAQEISENINTIAATSEDNKAQMQSLSASAIEIESQTAHVEELMSQYKL